MHIIAEKELYGSLFQLALSEENIVCMLEKGSMIKENLGVLWNNIKDEPWTYPFLFESVAEEVLPLEVIDPKFAKLANIFKSKHS